MKKIGWRIYTVFTLAFVVTLIFYAPATLLASLVESLSKGQLLLANASGTVWKGTATPSIRQRAGKLLALEKLHWEIDALPIFSGKIISRLQWENVEQTQPMLVTASYGQLELRNTLLPLQAGVLGEFTPMLKPVQLSGKINIKSELITLSTQGISGIAVADWINAGSVLSAVNPLGSYRINLVGAGEKLSLELTTTTGALQLDGNGSFSAVQGLKFTVTARAAEEGKGKIDELLNNFGPESSPGVHTLNLM